jgi:hypothetical protein
MNEQRSVKLGKESNRLCQLFALNDFANLDKTSETWQERVYVWNLESRPPERLTSASGEPAR